jgi:Ca2+-binding RTX toxin-like protein
MNSVSLGEFLEWKPLIPHSDAPDCSCFTPGFSGKWHESGSGALGHVSGRTIFMAIEKLDWPALLSVSVNSTLGLLAVSGTSTIDLRSITQSGAAVTAANSKAKYMYSAASIKHVDISLWSAGDSVTIANNVLVPVGKGNDTLIGWPGNRPIESRNGPNSLYGGTGNDTIDGGAGFDNTFPGEFGISLATVPES